MPTSDDTRAWLVADAWSLARRERSPLEASLRTALRAPVADQQAAVRAATDLLPPGRAAALAAALTSGSLSGLDPAPHVGGVTLADLSSAAPADTRAAALELLATVLEEAGSPLSDTVRAAQHSAPIEQLVALWTAWTGDLDPFLFAFVALTRAVVLGNMPPDEQHLVGLRYLGLV